LEEEEGRVVKDRLKKNYTKEQLTELFNYVDENHSGAISYKEFKTAFEGGNAEKFAKRQNFEVSAKNMIMYHMCKQIRQSKTKLYNVWSDLKRKGDCITVNDFLAALKASNILLQKEGPVYGLAEDQMKKLHQIMVKNSAGTLNFPEFLKMFEVRVKY